MAKVVTWTENATIDMLTIGKRIRSCMNSDQMEGYDWYTGKIINIDYIGENRYVVDIRRDDGHGGGGQGGSWNTIFTKGMTEKCYQIEEKDWDV